MDDNTISHRGADIQKRIPGIMETIMLDDIAVEMRKLNKHFAKENFDGVAVSENFLVNDTEQYLDIVPRSPAWTSCSLLNTGANNAQALINQRGDWLTLLPLTPINIDFRGAADKIWRISYKCPNPGNTTTILVNGKY
jgi:hypothetical protein